MTTGTAGSATVSGDAAKALETTLRGAGMTDLDAALVAVARALARTLDVGVTTGASLASIASVSKEYASVLARLGLTPESRKESAGARDAFDELVADLRDAPVGDPTTA